MINDYPTLSTYLIQKDSYTAYIARDDFCNTVYDPCSIELYIHDSIPRLVDDYTRSNLKRPTQRKVIIHTINRFQPGLFSLSFSLALSLTCYRHRKRKNKSASPFHLEKFDTKKWGKGRRGRSERRSIATVQRRRRVRTAQLEPEEFRRLDISSNDHPARSGRPINRQDLAWLARGGGSAVREVRKSARIAAFDRLHRRCSSLYLVRKD